VVTLKILCFRKKISDKAITRFDACWGGSTQSGKEKVAKSFELAAMSNTESIEQVGAMTKTFLLLLSDLGV
jgi:hypothetical protein